LGIAGCDGKENQQGKNAQTPASHQRFPSSEVNKGEQWKRKNLWQL
jgi:hypothetical protein